MRLHVLALMGLLVLCACMGGGAMPDDLQGDPEREARVLVMGDSLLAFNRARGTSVGNWLQAGLREPVIDRSAKGASMLRVAQGQGRAAIPGQYQPDAWEWVVINGYGNDLLFGCGCGACRGTLDRLIAADGRSGAIPDLVAIVRASGARVIYLGYLRTPGFDAPVEGCAPLGRIMDDRLAAMASRDRAVTYLSLADLVPEGDTSFHGPDRIHPSPKGSRAIANAVLARIAARD